MATTSSGVLLHPDSLLEASLLPAAAGRRSTRRRIVYNDDGGAVYPRAAGFNARATEGPEGLLSARFNYTIGTQVDSYWWCVGDGQFPAWASWFSIVTSRGERWEIPEAIGDPNQVMVEAAHREQKEIFASLRMNDTHDALREYPITYPLKVQHPEYMIAPKLQYHQSQIERFVSSALNYAIPEVRKHRFEFIDRLCRQYDFDGFEMDFMRHAAFFKIGEEKKHIHTMTDFVRRVRTLLRQIGKERGRPYPLAARVADTPELSLNIGLDTETWLKEGLLDVLVVGGGYAPFTTPVHEYIVLGHRYGLPVYPCANYSHFFDQPEAQRGMATNFFAAGADGIYLFNPFMPAVLHRQDPERMYGTFREIGDPATLRFKDKLFIIEPLKPALHMARITAPIPLPLGLSERRALNLVVGEDLSSRSVRQKLREVQLRLTTGDRDPALLTVQLNGSLLTENRVIKEGSAGEFSLPAQVLRKGANRLEISSPGGKQGTVKEVQVWVRYST